MREEDAGAPACTVGARAGLTAKSTCSEQPLV